ncbi:MAG: hypothetical protein QOH61_1568 [Chloroflexota bacterium]|nr:hypothetical protein [Chloroflexota bacterium]
MVIATLALLSVAIAKPWSRPSTDNPALLPARPTPSAGQPSPPRSTLAAVAVAAIDWDVAAASLRPHDRWGMRAMVATSDRDDAVPRPGLSAPIVTEVWAPLHEGLMDGTPAVVPSEGFAWIQETGVVAALGITTPLDDLPLDVRAWRDAEVGWIAVPVDAVAPTDDPTARLLIAPAGWSADGGWPSGSYRVDVLLESGVRHVAVQLAGDREVVPENAGPRAAPVRTDLNAMAGAPGAFIYSGTDKVSYLFAGLPASDRPHDEAEAWLALQSDQLFWAPGLSEPQPPVLNVASVLGAAAAPDERIVSAKLVRISPDQADLGAAELIQVPEPGAPNRAAVAVFRAKDSARGFPAGEYRIDAQVQRGARRPASVSWDLPVLPRPTGTVSTLLTAARGWSQVPHDHWTVLAPGRRIAVRPVPGDAPAAVPDATCSTGANVGIAPWYIGVTHPGDPFDTVDVRLLEPENGGFATPVRVEFSQVLPGILVLRPLGHDWAAGSYAVGLWRGAGVETVTLCVH